MTWQGEEDEDLSPKQWVYAVIHSVKVIEMDNFGINYYEELGPIEVVDLSTIQCVIGQIHDRDHWAIIDHSRWSGLLQLFLFRTIPNYYHLILTHHSNSVAFDSTHMTYLL